MSKGLIDSILDSFFDEKWVGQRGEKLTERELKLVSLFGRKGKTLRNLYVPIETQVIEGKKYILIPADTEAEINGFTVQV